MNNSTKFIKVLKNIYDSINSDYLDELAKDCIIDFIACAYAGNKMIGEKIQALLKYSANDGNAPIIGTDIKTSPSTAALINAMNAHATELDDGHRFAMLHVEAPIVSALISAVSVGLINNSKDFLKGIIIGYEVTCRLAQVMQPGHKIKGFHATGTCAVCGAALAIGFAAGYSEEELQNTLSAAVASAAGLLEMIDSPSQLKPYTVGNAAQNGFVSACIGKAGFVGPNDPLSGKRGFFNAFASDIDIEKLFVKENTYKIEQRYTKPYASCRHCHPSIEAALKVKNENYLNIEDIKTINIETYSLAIFGHDNKDIVSMSAAKMSTPFSVATALFNNEAGFNSYSVECIKNSTINELMNKVTIVESEEFNAVFPEKRGAIVTITLNDGNELSYRVDYPLGEPENPMNRDAIKAKYYELGLFAGKHKEQLDIILEKTLSFKDDINKWINDI